MYEQSISNTYSDTMKSWIEERQPISPHQWFDASAKVKYPTRRH